MILLPRLTYATIVWWTRVEKVETKNLFKSLQCNYLRAVAEAMKTTPTKYLKWSSVLHLWFSLSSDLSISLFSQTNCIQT